MDDWHKRIDPLKNMDVFGGLDTSGTTRNLSQSVGIGRAIGGAITNFFARKRIEKQHREEQERLAKTAANPPPLHGSARWASAGELSAAGFLKPESHFDSPSSLLLGTFLDPGLDNAVAGQFHWDGEGHLLTVAPTRSGKSTTTIVPNLVRYKGSCVVLDPKGELYRETAAWRKTVGPVYRIAPFEERTDAFNPLATLGGFSDARALADLIMPPDPNSQNFFRNDAISILGAMIFWIAMHAPPGKRTLAEVRTITGSSLEKFRSALGAMAASDDPAIANAPQVVLSKDPQRSVPALRDTINSELSLFDDPGLRRAMAHNTVDFAALKERPATVYITVPFHRMQAYAAFLKIALTTALDAMVESPKRPDIPVLFVLDEFLALGPFPKFRDAIRTHAGAGVRLWFFLQDVPTLEEHYPNGWKTFFNTSVKTFFGTDEAYTGRQVSEFLGDETRAYVNHTLTSQEAAPHGAGHASRSGSMNSSVTFLGRPLLTPTEVVQKLGSTFPDQTRSGIVFVRGVPPVDLRLVPWFLGPKCRERVTKA